MERAVSREIERVGGLGERLLIQDLHCFVSALENDYLYMRQRYLLDLLQGSSSAESCKREELWWCVLTDNVRQVETVSGKSLGPKTMMKTL